MKRGWVTSMRSRKEWISSTALVADIHHIEGCTCTIYLIRGGGGGGEGTMEQICTLAVKIYIIYFLRRRFKFDNSMG